MSPAALWPFVVLAAAGSVHCAGMCGGFALVVSERAVREGRSRGLALALYSLGKTATYVTLGLLLVHSLRSGGLLARGTHLGSLQRTLAVVSGVLLVGLGLQRWIGSRGSRAGSLGPVARAMQRVLAGARQLDSRAAALGTGLVSGYLPCGLTVAALALAAGTGPAEAAAGLTLFGIATTPALAVAGLAPAALAPRLRTALSRAIAPALIVLGLMTAWRGVASMGESAHGAAGCPACEADAYEREP